MALGSDDKMLNNVLSPLPFSFTLSRLMLPQLTELSVNRSVVLTFLKDDCAH